MTNEAFGMLKDKGVKIAKHNVVVQLTPEQAAKLKAIAVGYNTNVASLLRVAIKCTYGIEITDDKSEAA